MIKGWSKKVFSKLIQNPSISDTNKFNLYYFVFICQSKLLEQLIKKKPF
jgi:hypothetical protein